MKIKMKNTFIIFLFLVFAKNAKADLLLSTFNLKNINTSNNSFLVNNLHIPTNIEFDVTIFKIGANQPGYCYITLLYTESPEDSNYENHPSTIELSSTKYITNSDYNVGPVGHQSIYAVAGLPAVLPAYSFSGRIVLKYRFFSTSKNEEVTRYSTAKFQVTIPPSTVSNDNYTGAISLSSVAIVGSTEGATYSPQNQTPCGYGNDIDDDVWYKFTATSATHTITLSDVSFYNTQWYQMPLTGIAVYNSSLGYLGCDNINGNFTATSLTVGQTYYVRIWSANVNNVMMTYKIALSTSGSNVITGISRSGVSLFEHILTASYSLDPSIPISDVTFEWQVYPGEVEPAIDYSVVEGVGSHQIHIIGGPGEGDTTVRARVRMKRISTNEPLTEWYVYSSLIWFG